MCQITGDTCKSGVILQCIGTRPFCSNPSNIVLCVVCCAVVMSKTWYVCVASGSDSCTVFLYPIGCSKGLCVTGL